MDQKVFNELRDIIYNSSGIALGDDKVPLLTTRLAKRLRALKMDSELEYIALLRQDKSGDELVKLIDVVSTNTTYFFRESEHFDFLKKAVADKVHNGANEIRIWCAAASSGEEPYTLSMTVKEALGTQRVPFKMLATDISLTVLRRAAGGHYSEEHAESVPDNLRSRYFKKIEIDGDEMYSVVDTLKKPILYKRLNLSNFPYPLKGPFDFIFCRNVMIYFNNDLKSKILGEFERLLTPDGYLVISKTESLVSIPTKLQTIGNSIYCFNKKTLK